MIQATSVNLKRNRHSRRTRRDGMILAAVLVALLVVMLLGAAFANLFIAQRRLVHQTNERQQAFWLAEAAVNRAKYRLANEVDYAGETWQVPSEHLDHRKSGVATIRIENVATPRSSQRIVVEAELVTTGSRQAIHHRELFVAIPQPKPQ